MLSKYGYLFDWGVVLQHSCTVQVFLIISSQKCVMKWMWKWQTIHSKYAILLNNNNNKSLIYVMQNSDASYTLYIIIWLFHWLISIVYIWKEWNCVQYWPRTYTHTWNKYICAYGSALCFQHYPNQFRWERKQFDLV